MNIYIDYMWNNFFMEVKSNFKYKFVVIFLLLNIKF